MKKMKKGLIAIALTFGLLVGNAGNTIVYADDSVPVKEAIEKAEEKSFDSEYSVTWSKENDKCWNKITLEDRGILEIYATQPYNNSLKYVRINVEVYKEDGTIITCSRDEEKKGDFSSYIGLEKGTYYVMMTPEYCSYVYGETSKYKFSFTKNENCELESNQDKKNATPMKVDTTYTGYLGGGFSNISEYKDSADVYAVQLKKGQVYKFIFEKKEHTEFDTTIIKLFGKNSDMDNTWPSVEAKNFCVSVGDTFIAPYSGTYYVRIYNYGSEQYKYEVKISTITLKKVSITSVKAGKNSFTAKWKKTDCTGYQVQYSTNKNFKNAKTLKVSGSKTSATIKKLSSNKKYYVRIRAYKEVKDKTAYSSWSKEKSVRVK